MDASVALLPSIESRNLLWRKRRLDSPTATFLELLAAAAGARIIAANARFVILFRVLVGRHRLSRPVFLVRPRCRKLAQNGVRPLVPVFLLGKIESLEMDDGFLRVSVVHFLRKLLRAHFDSAIALLVEFDKAF